LRILSNKIIKALYMKVPLLDVKAQNQPIANKLRAAFERVLESGMFILGKEVSDFEKSVADYCECPHALGVSSGTDAITLALMSIGIGPGDEVLCPAFTFVATGNCVARLGATPVFVDISPLDFNINVVDAAKKITPRTKAIIPVHLFGQSADMGSVMALAKTHNLVVIEDAAQAIGARYKGRRVGSIGDFGTFSFFPSKNLGALGDGGLLTSRDPALHERCRLLRVYGGEPKYFYDMMGGNFRLDPLQAAFLSIKLEELDGYTNKRKQNGRYYNEKLSALPGVAMTTPENALLGDYLKILLPYVHPHCDMIYNQYTLRVLGEGKRDALKAHLIANDIGCEIYYPKTLDQQKCFENIGTGRESIYVAHRIANECLSLPIYGELTKEQLGRVVEVIGEFVENS
jgi:dTDP-4-amino-4,6-dideoxygalactose transaminase